MSGSPERRSGSHSRSGSPKRLKTRDANEVNLLVRKMKQDTLDADDGDDGSDFSLQFEICVDRRSTVADFKALIESRVNIPPPRMSFEQRGYFAIREWEDGRTLASYDLSDWNIVYVADEELPGQWPFGLLK